MPDQRALEFKAGSALHTRNSIGQAKRHTLPAAGFPSVYLSLACDLVANEISPWCGEILTANGQASSIIKRSRIIPAFELVAVTAIVGDLDEVEMNEWVVGVDLGGTKIEIGLVSPQNQIIGRRRIPTNAAEGPQSVVDRIAQSIVELVPMLPDGARIDTLGVCCPGPVDHEAGALIDPPNLPGLHYAPLRQMLARQLNLVVRLEHDAKATALGEFYYGAGRGERSMVYIVVGTGVGGAIVADGQLFRGLHNSAGEVGHITLEPQGEPCSCGSRGCVETFVSGPWLARRYLKALDGQGRTALPETQVTGERVAQLAWQGDSLASRIIAEAGEALGVAIASMPMILNIDLFVVGGSVAKCGDLLLEPAREALPQHAYRSVGCGVRIVATELGDDGPLLGCAWLARQALAQCGPHTRELRGDRASATGRAHQGAGYGDEGDPRSVSQAAQAAFVTPAAGFSPAGIAPARKLRHTATDTPERLTASEHARLEQIEGVVFDIQRFSLHDGRGIRTNVFLKGCPLRCRWCANPESQRPQPELAFSAQNCISCGLFADPCSAGWGAGGWRQLAHETYGERAASCPTRAIRWIGERRSAGEVIQTVLRDLPFYHGGGGMTLSGGEPTFQPLMAEALLRLAKAHGISTAIETAGHTRWKILERLLPYLDQILFDVKHVDGATHRALTGVDNVLILSNLRQLAALRAPVTVRVPLIPGFNATEASLRAIAELVLGLDGLQKAVCLLPYHTLGRAKYALLGREYLWDGYARYADEAVAELAQVVASYGLAVSIGG